MDIFSVGKVVEAYMDRFVFELHWSISVEEDGLAMTDIRHFPCST